MKEAKTLGELKEAGYIYHPVREEIQHNLIKKLQKKEELFPGIHGYENTVIPQLIHALLGGQNIVLLGERGQAKSRIMRSLTSLLDEWIPIVDGSPIPEDPFSPITIYAKKILEEKKEKTPIRWLNREERYKERISAGLKISDLIGDIDPSKVLGGSPLDTEGALFFGIIPRANRGIFGMNELPDLDYLVQVALFNLLEEKDIQIRGYPFHFPLDVLVIFTANPADYTRSGKIIPQLKDRIGSEIRTHYPLTREIALKITRQEANLPPSPIPLEFPSFMEEINEELTKQARESKYINQRVGISARFSISNYEVLASSALRRALLLNEEKAVVRPSDMGNLFASSCGKLELDPYRDEAITEYHLFQDLLQKAVGVVFREYFPSSWDKALEKVVKEVHLAEKVEVGDELPAEKYQEILLKIPSLFDFLEELKATKDIYLSASVMEFVLEGLVSLKKLSRRRLGQISQFKAMDMY